MASINTIVLQLQMQSRSFGRGRRETEQAKSYKVDKGFILGSSKIGSAVALYKFAIPNMKLVKRQKNFNIAQVMPQQWLAQAQDTWYIYALIKTFAQYTFGPGKTYSIGCSRASLSLSLRIKLLERSKTQRLLLQISLASKKLLLGTVPIGAKAHKT